MLLTAACATEPPPPSVSPTQVVPPPVEKALTIGRVVSVVGGATIDVEVDGQVLRVQYLGIEVPDAEPPGTNGQPLRERALEFNRFLVDGRTVELEKGAVEANALGHLLRYVYVDGEMVNMALLTNGYAAVASFPPDFRHRTSFAMAEESAKREQRGYWSPAPEAGKEDGSATPASSEPFSGGTLPSPPGLATSCDHSTTGAPAIKGNVDSQTGERVYHVPGGIFYSTTEVSAADGDRWFCTEEEAVAAGWTKSKH